MAGGNFMHRVISYVVNELVVDRLANSHAFQRFAVRTSKKIEDISSIAAKKREELAEQMKEISKNMEKTFPMAQFTYPKNQARGVGTSDHLALWSSLVNKPNEHEGRHIRKKNRPWCNDFDIGQYPNFDDETADAEEDVVNDNEEKVTTVNEHVEHPFSYGVGKSETSDSWTWFMGHLRDCICPISNLTIISDRANSIDNAIRMCFSYAFHGLCGVHLYRNLKSRRVLPQCAQTLEDVGLKDGQEYINLEQDMVS
ncbi:protein SCO1-like protein 1 [Hibiscus syriacus]|uniref:Protein SCO1-like protein 1 n=1 Tax=Hibiscus syriacus TaxID=106335 RepID=A0A6A2ZLZ4_HIBSY|nr:protein SCO1-like protein 1 [Hibiscus syriacus]